MKMRTFIDLFAGCGGLSLGLEQAGFIPLLFSEINKDAASTYLVNRKKYEIENYPDIYDLTNRELRKLKKIWIAKGVKEVDLVCGGPPCQGYSGIGHRRSFQLDKEAIPSNHLYKEMARVIKYIKPKIFLFENVRGLLTSRWTKNGQNGEILNDVLITLRSIGGYQVRWKLISAKDYGVPQNRPRILVVGIRNDIVRRVMTSTVQNPKDMMIQSAVTDGFLPKPNGFIPPDPPELLDDLVDPAYPNILETTTYPRKALNTFQLGLRTCPDGSVLKKGDVITEHQYSRHSQRVRDKFAYMIQNNGEIPDEFRTKKFAQRVLPSKWSKSGPNITTTSLPDDFVHYSQPRSLTVREWARFQTFPDWYEFRGPRTTGGRRRAGDPSSGIWDRDVPRYTQIGNAVPVLLAKVVGDHLYDILGDFD